MLAYRCSDNQMTCSILQKHFNIGPGIYGQHYWVCHAELHTGKKSVRFGVSSRLLGVSIINGSTQQRTLWIPVISNKTIFNLQERFFPYKSDDRKQPQSDPGEPAALKVSILNIDEVDLHKRHHQGENQLREEEGVAIQGMGVDRNVGHCAVGAEILPEDCRQGSCRKECDCRYKLYVKARLIEWMNENLALNLTVSASS